MSPDDRVREHYLIERELSDRLRSASAQERRTLYAEVYEELFRRVPNHPQAAGKVDAAARRKMVADQLAVLGPLLRPATRYLEIGAGDCALTFAVAARVQSAWAIEVSKTIAASDSTPANFKLVLSDGCSLPVPGAMFDVIYSNQVMEHLHPDDAMDQLREIHAALAPGGRYLCITPNRLNGPHDVSRDFDDTPTGFHLREYTNGELARMFRAAGFSKVQARVGARGVFVPLPVAPIAWVESLLSHLPTRFRRRLAGSRALRRLLEIRLSGAR